MCVEALIPQNVTKFECKLVKEIVKLNTTTKMVPNSVFT